ncbi:right-handed parallel beta-helix repeat-containing protein [Agriterribacter humi]|uniref:right-handed parallel beta-helix repeat-containing protein n=1 Tax=Agriterribacter humi TaxID=1104781 RepID=UPI0012651140|nr:right-handed parallel beta-helix repeat-containing protein [Agriterribacter humi]
MRALFSRTKIFSTWKFCFSLIALVGINILAISAPGNSSPKPVLKLYVSTVGNDNWSGKLSQPNRNKTDGPFATIEGTRDAIRILKKQKKLPKGDIIVEIRAGVYELPGTFELEAEDGGADAHSRIIYVGQKGKEVRLSGGKNLTKWDLVTDEAVLNKFSSDVRGKIYQSDLAAIGINDFGSPGGGGIELFFNNEPMWLSRYPNKGFVKITGLLNEDPVDIRGTKGDKVGKFNYEDQRINEWKNEKDAWVSGYWFWDWSEQSHKVSKIDTEKKIMEVAPPYHTYGYRLGQWFYGFNLLSEIDEPGEYYVDREKGILYFYPPSGVKKGHAFVSVNKNIISMNKVSFLTIQGVILEGCRETVVKMEDCNQALLVGCTVRNAGDEGIVINGGIRNGVVGCDIYGVGSGGIKIDAGDRSTLTPAECFADNNNIHHIARIKRVYFPGISLNGVGNRATHNLIKQIPHMAIYFNGNDHLMEYNEISDVCYESNDAGAVYAGRNWTMRGNIIRYNYLHDISGFEGKGCVGVYLDDAFCGVDIIGNVFDKVTRAMMIGGGRDNNVLNNIFIDCVPSLHVDARGLGWMHDHPEEWIKDEKEKGTILGIAYNKPPYSTRYPKLINIINDEPKAPKGNVISHNVCQGGAWDKNVGFWRTSIEDKARPYVTMNDNVVAPNSAVKDSLSESFVIVDPLFTNQKNPKQGGYQLSADSPALERGFKQVPFGKIGLYQSDNRASWPVSKK